MLPPLDPEILSALVPDGGYGGSHSIRHARLHLNTHQGLNLNTHRGLSDGLLCLLEAWNIFGPVLSYDRKADECVLEGKWQVGFRVSYLSSNNTKLMH